jgi:hypothetical protein
MAEFVLRLMMFACATPHRIAARPATSSLRLDQRNQPSLGLASNGWIRPISVVHWSHSQWLLTDEKAAVRTTLLRRQVFPGADTTAFAALKQCWLVSSTINYIVR